MNTRHDAEVIVVGGGPAGAATAWSLASRGADVLLLDRAAFPRSKPCAEYLNPLALRVLDAMGATAAIERAGAPRIAGMKLRAPNGVVFTQRLAPIAGFRGLHSWALALQRDVLDAIVLDCARAAGARIEEEVHVSDVLRDDTGRVTGVAVRDKSGTRELRARIVVGADGLHSVVARRLGLLEKPRRSRRFAFVSYYRGVSEMTAYGELHFERGGYCGLAPLAGGFVNVAAVVPADGLADAHENADAILNRRIAAHPDVARRLAGAERVTPVRATGPFGMRTRRAWAPGVALVGDAADFFDPVTGDGMAAALRGGELLGPYLAAALRASTPAAADVLLAEYDRARCSEFAWKWQMEHFVALLLRFPSALSVGAPLLRSQPLLSSLVVGLVSEFVPFGALLRPLQLTRTLAAGTDR